MTDDTLSCLYSAGTADAAEERFAVATGVPPDI
jgi:hypothetical protein